jgi:hypothetical protein
VPMVYEDAERVGHENTLFNVAPRTTGVLRCIRCHRRRSKDYHWKHWHNPVLNPASGICSRKRTKCAEIRAQTYADNRTVVYELPATQSRTWKSDTYAA